jgi:hypothetical protein
VVLFVKYCPQHIPNLSVRLLLFILNIPKALLKII